MTYRYLLGADISMEDVNESLMLAILAMECLHGAAREPWLNCHTSSIPQSESARSMRQPTLDAS